MQFSLSHTIVSDKASVSRYIFNHTDFGWDDFAPVFVTCSSISTASNIKTGAERYGNKASNKVGCDHKRTYWLLLVRTSVKTSMHTHSFRTSILTSG